MSESPGLWPSSDVGARVVAGSLFRFLVDLQVQQAQRLRYSVSFVSLAADVISAEARELSFPSLAKAVARYLRATDVVAPWANGSLALLLIDAETSHLPLIHSRLTVGLDPIVWSAGGSCYPRTAACADDMLRQAIDSMTRAKAEGGNRLYVS